MIWKLFATVLAITDHGQLAMTSFTADFRIERDCTDTVEDLFRQPRAQNIAGIGVTFKITASCREVRQ